MSHRLPWALEVLAWVLALTVVAAELLTRGLALLLQLAAQDDLSAPSQRPDFASGSTEAGGSTKTAQIGPRSQSYQGIPVLPLSAPCGDVSAPCGDVSAPCGDVCFRPSQ